MMRSILFKTAGKIVFDGQDMDVNPGMELTLLPAREIVEVGIDHIEVTASASSNRDYRPKDGTAKWFRDELGQIWVKFTVAPTGWYPQEVQYVIPAERVVQVAYFKDAPTE